MGKERKIIPTFVIILEFHCKFVLLFIGRTVLVMQRIPLRCKDGASFISPFFLVLSWYQISSLVPIYLAVFLSRAIALDCI